MRNYYLFNRTTWLDTTVEHTSKAFLGITLNCAKCHDHKFDPFSQVDYYRFRAIFEPHQVRMEMLPGETNLERDGLPTVFDAHPNAPTYVLRRGDEKQPDRSQSIGPGVPAFLDADAFQVTPVNLPAEASAPSLRPYVKSTFLAEADLRVARAAALENARDRLKPDRLKTDRLNAAKGRPAKNSPLDQAKAAHRAARLRVNFAERSLRAGQGAPRVHAGLVRSRPRAAIGNVRGRRKAACRQNGRIGRTDSMTQAEADAAQMELAAADAATSASAREIPAHRQAVQQQSLVPKTGPLDVAALAAIKAPEGPVETEAARRAPFPRTSTGRRTALAHWLVDGKNPLTARVAVNHVWMRHMNRPLVESVADSASAAHRRRKKSCSTGSPAI